jgi:K+-sensing histidine kinase KdpD
MSIGAGRSTEAPDQPAVWTVLIADDCAEDREIYREYLHGDPHQRYHILEAGSAEQGLLLCQQSPIDVLLLDFQLPDLSGLEFLDELKTQLSPALDLAATLPVIMLTGNGDETIAVQAMKRGAQDYLLKNHLPAETLQRAVRNAVQQARLQTQLNQSRDRQRLIATVALRMRESSDLKEILEITITEVRQLLRCERVEIYPASHLKQTLAGDIAAEITVQHPHDLVAPILCHTHYPASSQDELGNRPGQTPAVWGWLIAADPPRGIPPAPPRQWQPEEASILQELAVHLAIAIQQAELLIHTQAALVKERELRLLKSKIITTISHEYRTPLSVILASASLLLKHGNELAADRQLRCLHFIEDKARHLTRLVDDMLVLEKYELDRSQFQPMPLDLPTLITDVVERQQQLAGEQYQLTLKIRGRQQGFWGDQGLLHLILINLLDNAVKYSPQGGDVEVVLQYQRQQVMLTIKDEGIGIPAAEQAGLFQSFSRGTNVETISGSGLGLAIVKACVETHGGTIQLHSRLGRGTKMSVTLPTRPVVLPAVPTLPSAAERFPAGRLPTSPSLQVG